MARVVFELGYQRKFLREIHATGLSWDEMAKISQVAWDTLRDWRRERRKMRYEAVENLCRVSGVDLPPILEILPDNPGTPEGRRKGGLNSCKKQAEPNFLKACIRGLFDTDGCIYYHHHVCKGKECLNIGAVFTSLSPPLCNSFHRFLISQDYRAKLSRGSRVYLYRQPEIIHYLQDIGTHNPKHRRRLDDFINRFK